MPKVKRKSVGRQFKGANPRRAQTPSQGSKEESSLLADSTVNDPTTAELEMQDLARNLSEEENGEVTAIRLFEAENTMTSGAENQPGPSGLQQKTIANPAATPEEEIREENEEVPFEVKLRSLNKMERRTAKAFAERGMEEEFEWPLPNETKDDAIRGKTTCCKKAQV